LKPPTLIVWGSRDRLVDPALAPRLAAAVPDSRLLVLDGVGHVAMLETPEPTARAVLGLVEGLDNDNDKDNDRDTAMDVVTDLDDDLDGAAVPRA
jgi:acetyl esterase/lipase